jgi:hypothetical protein
MAAALPGDGSGYGALNKALQQLVIESQRPDLGTEGNLIRGMLGSGFSRDTFDNYWQAQGDMPLSADRFNDIVDSTKNLKQVDGPTPVTSPDGEPLIRRQFSFYGSPEYRKALGTASLFYSPDGKPVGFYDYYNFDPSTPENPKKRSLMAEGEVEVDLMHVLGPLHGAKDFPIYYGKYVAPNQ